MKESIRFTKVSEGRSDGQVNRESDAGILRRYLMARERKAALRALNVAGRLHRVLNLSHGVSGSSNLLRYTSNIDVLDATYQTSSNQRLCMPGFQHDATPFHIIDSEILLENDSVDCIFCQNMLPALIDSNDRVKLISEFSRVSSRWLIVSLPVSNGRIPSKSTFGLSISKAGSPVVSDALIDFELAKGGFEVVAKIRVGLLISDYCHYVCRLR